MEMVEISITMQKEQKCSINIFVLYLGKRDHIVSPYGDGNALSIPLMKQEDVKQKPRKIDSLKSADPDNLHPRVLKQPSREHAGQLLLIFSKSWSARKSPGAWKKANVVPIFKKSKRDNSGNYRPVSLTSIPGKILE